MSAPSTAGATPFRDGWPLLQPTGFRLHPLDGKRPILQDWPHVATNDPNTLREWGLQYGTYNIGIVLGHYPEQGRTYFVVDLDRDDETGRHGVDSFNEYRLAREGQVPPTLTQQTGGGGYQLFFWVPSTSAIPNKVKVIAGVDIRGDGGQVAAPPSIHPDTGVPYHWLSLESIAEAPLWVLGLAGAYSRGDQKPSGGSKPDSAVDGPPIPEHERNDALFKIASSLRSKGLTRNAILGQLHDINNARCQPPLALEELQWIADSVMRYDPQPSDMPNWPPKNDGTLPPPPGDTTVDDDLNLLEERNTDRYNGLEFAKIYADKLVYTEQAGWLVWDGHRWRPDSLLEHQKFAGDLVTVFAIRMREAADLDARELLWNRIKRIESAAGMKGCLTFAASRMTRDLTDFDGDPWLINFTNGTMNLRTFEMRPHNPEDLLTRMCTVAYDPKAVDPVWETFLENALPDPDMRHTFHAFMGSCLTGITKDKAILLPHGETNTGKSTAVEPCFAVLGRMEEGGYAATWSADVVERNSRANVEEKKNQARGARLIVVGELTRGSKFNDGFVKQFSGGDTVSARALYKASYSFRPQAKLVMHTNFVPRSPDKATQERLKLMPFTNRFEPRDEGIKVYLERNVLAQAAIAAWLVRGCYLWQTEGLGKMPWLAEILHAYDLDSNPVAAFVEDVLEMTTVTEEYITVDDMWMRYQAYEMGQGGKSWQRRTFERALEERGLQRARVPAKGGRMRWVGFRVRQVEPPPYTV